MANIDVTVQDGAVVRVQLGENTMAAAASAADAAQSAAYAGGFETPEYASQSAGNAATTPGQIFRVPLGTAPQTFNWYRRLSSGSELVSPLVSAAALAGPSGAGGLGFTQSGAGAVTRTAQAKMRDTVSVKDFGAVGDGVADDTDAIESALAAIPTGGALYFPAGAYRVTSQIVVPPAKRLSLIGQGSRQSELIYVGANTTNDCFVFGDGTADCNGYKIEGINFIANVNMTGGALARFRRLTRSSLKDVRFGHQDGNSNPYIGAWFDGIDSVSMDGFECRAKEDGLRVNGGTGGRADLFLSNFKIASCKNGIHVAGDFGGLYVDAGSIINNATNVLIDQAVTAVNNRETFFGPGCFIDTASLSLNPNVGDGICVDIQDTGGFVFFRNTWVAFAGTLIRTGASFAGTVQLDGGILFKSLTADGGAARGISIGSTSTVVVINGTLFQEINNEGVICTAGNTTNVFLNAPVFRNNVGTPVHSSIQPVSASNAQAVFNRKLVSGARAPIASAADGSPAQTFAQGALGGSTHIARYLADAAPARIELSKSRNATVGSQTIVQNGDVLAAISMSGSDGTDFETGVEIRAVVEGAPGLNNMPVGLEIFTRSGAGAMARRVRISAAGLVILDGLPTSAPGTSGALWRDAGAGNVVKAVP
jgi:hypothetical protein